MRKSWWTICLLAAVAWLPVRGADAPVYTIDADASDLFVRDWLVLGPFPSEPLDKPTPEGYTRAGFGHDFLATLGGERAATFSSATTLEDVGAARRLEARPDGVADLTRLYGDGERRVAYLFSWVESPVAQTITFFFGSDDGGKVWVNGEPVHTAWIAGGRGVRFREETFRAKLKPGRNRLLIKIEQNGPGWGTAIEALPRPKARAVLEPMLQVEPRVEKMERAGQGWAVQIKAALNHDETLFPELKQRIAITAADGRLVADREIAVGESLTIEIPDGAYGISARIKEPKPLGGEGAILAVADEREFARAQVAMAREARNDPRLEATAGWFSYLAEKLDAALAATDEEPGMIAMLAYRVARWRTALAQDPNAWLKQTGSIEWAYLSKIDGSGQPFTLRIPDAYTPNRHWPLVVSMHGAGGTHGSRWGEAHPEEHFELFVNGRGRTGGYIELSEVDVLEATDYVQRHWRISADEVHLTGGSMGGYGTFTVGSRHPDRWATAVPWAGSAAHLPTENMLNLPTYALHSDDDFVVPVSGARAGVRRINEVGGAAIMAETTGLGHQFGRWAEGRAAMLDWRQGKRRPSSTEIRRVVYTATDELARGAYWVRVEEWGPWGKPARVDARFAADNALHIDTDNVRVLRVSLADSPADLGRRLHVVVNANTVTRLESPLPREIHVVQENGAPRVVTEKPAEPGYRRHFPGGVTALYHGEPLLLVYGTRGGPEITDRLRRMAEACSRLSRFSASTGDLSTMMTYGGLPVKADHEVTREDLERCNVIVFGSADENALAAQFADRLPIRIDRDAKRIVADDDAAWSLDGRGFGLLHYNPEVPSRLIYWISATEAALYDPGSVLMAVSASREPAPDFVLVDDEGRLIAARRFDSRWKWESGYTRSPPLTKHAKGETTADWFAASLRNALGCEFVVQEDASTVRAPWKHADETRVADLAAFSYAHRLAKMTLTGDELKRALKAVEGPRSRVRIFPRPDEAKIEDETRYLIGLIGLDMRGFVMTTRIEPKDYHVIDLTARGVIFRE